MSGEARQAGGRQGARRQPVQARAAAPRPLTAPGGGVASAALPAVMPLPGGCRSCASLPHGGGCVRLHGSCERSQPARSPGTQLLQPKHGQHQKIKKVKAQRPGLRIHATQEPWSNCLKQLRHNSQGHAVGDRAEGWKFKPQRGPPARGPRAALDAAQAARNNRRAGTVQLALNSAWPQGGAAGGPASEAAARGSSDAATREGLPSHVAQSERHHAPGHRWHRRRQT